ncbi:PREDICTED: uncharacterized protein LOC109189702 [Ipomoea nil]|uniref:uncharacterized protein LOC109189702 n=1 Tax=Ipomoea nil TaxID=35883 RepID=UPI000900926D|nr:PREDICTED: uncharacterized protein LOC109189702 [Ipomoea nil]XP_019195860.1 PREDICTED: uncharacterized protein LOC109189702 [Ipomoea nil]
MFSASLGRMDSTDDGGTTEGTHNTQSSTQTTKKRGATRMQKIIRQRNAFGKLQVELDGFEPVYGKAGNEFKSYVGLVARINTPITIKEWSDIPEDTKATIWKEILSTFDIPDTIDMKRHWLSYVGDRWKDFKTKLVNKYIYGQNPCQTYDFIEQETWNEFYQSHTGESYEATRKKYQDIQAKNIHPHLLARGGYKRLEKMMMDEKLKEQQALADADPSYTMSPPSPIRRVEKWKKARMDKSGNYRTDSTRVVAEKIDALELQISQGEFIEDGRKDSLTVALGTDEHCGRVRAMGRGHGIKSVFGHAKRRQKTPEDVQQLVDAAVGAAVGAAVAEALEKQKQENISEWEEFGQRITEQFEAKIASMMLQFSAMQTPLQPKQVTTVCVDAVPPPPSDKASSPDPFSNLPALGARCQLFLEDPIRRPVAYGTTYSGRQVHGVVLDVNNVKVSITDVGDPTAHVPFPTGEVKLVSDASQHFIVWPKKLVELCT